MAKLLADYNAGGYIELHFLTEDGSHTVNADTLNKCVYEYLGIIHEISLKFHVDIFVESEALSEGGVRSWLKINLPSKDEFKKQLILDILVSISTLPIMTTCSTVVNHYVEQLLTPSEITKLQKEKEKAQLEYEIAWYQNESRKLADTVNNELIAKKTSNFYSAAKNCAKISAVEVASTTPQKETIERKKINRAEFDNFILDSDDLDPTEDDEAIIEIVSPVLKKGKYKWSGIYNNEVIPFSVTSNEFKTLVQTGEISFKNGTSIKCQLIIKRKLDSEGNEKIVGYEVPFVEATFENDKPVETPEGKRRRQQKEADKLQLSLFDEDLTQQSNQ